MDSPTLTSQSNNNYANVHLDTTLSTTTSGDMASASNTEQANTQNTTQMLAPNSIILADVLTDKTIAWRIHNCKINKKTVTQDLPLPFLYHYDSLEDSIKLTHPLTPALLAQFNTPMTAQAAAKLIGIDTALLANPWQVKVVGSLVVFSETLQLAVRLHWTNTGKDTQQVYTKDKEDALTTAFKDWQFFGRIDVLYKNNNQPLVSVDEQRTSTDSILPLETSAEYQLLPAAHALATLSKLDADKVELPWFETAILERLE